LLCKTKQSSCRIIADKIEEGCFLTKPILCFHLVPIGMVVVRVYVRLRSELGSAYPVAVLVQS
jgi:hypothetical protein